MKTVCVIDKANGAVLARFALIPALLALSEFSVEFGDGLQRLFVIRNAKTRQVFDSVAIGDCPIKIVTKNI